ncbi:hypothetical protein BD770DRAFT_401374 [Pilaira anomala]|nr:hypothetical protein BD770DRAFT_401374 [Pilaira anomala]
MVYLMWHARKAMASERSFANTEMAYLLWQSRKPSSRANHYSPLGGGSGGSGGGDHSLSYTASPAFKKFCYQVLTATQLQESAVYLSLKYIAILLQSNPSIEGAEGSEYRLFIVALMLANKFLDDNTFTNKTWSDVSGMKVRDLNIMEAEFLEALEYNLFVRKDDYDNWKGLLELCRERSQLSVYDINSRQRQQLVLLTLQTLGLYQFNQYEDAIKLQIENSHNRYQHFLQQQQQYIPSLPSPPVQLPYVMQPPVGYGYNPITNLSQSSWDPLAYSLNRCQDYSYSNFSTARPISWRNFNY